MTRYFDPDGNEITEEAWWITVFPSGSSVAFDEAPGGAAVSTQYIGVAADDENPPLIYQTHIHYRFGTKTAAEYANRAEAEVGHQRILDELRSEL